MLEIYALDYSREAILLDLYEEGRIVSYFPNKGRGGAYWVIVNTDNAISLPDNIRLFSRTDANFASFAFYHIDKLLNEARGDSFFGSMDRSLIDDTRNKLAVVADRSGIATLLGLSSPGISGRLRLCIFPGQPVSRNLIEEINSWLGPGNMPRINTRIDPRIGTLDLTDMRMVGIELEFTGMTRRVAEVIVAKYPGFGVVRDSSVVATPGADQLEITTPPMTLDEMWILKELIGEMEANGAVSNKSCGLHIHVNMLGWPVYHVGNLLKKFVEDQEFLFFLAGTLPKRTVRYCKRVSCNTDLVTPEMTVNDLATIVYGTSDHLRSRVQNHYEDARYHAFNLHAWFHRSTVEFRLFNGTLNWTKIEKWARFCTRYAYEPIKAIDLANEMYFSRAKLWTPNEQQSGVIDEAVPTVDTDDPFRSVYQAHWNTEPEPLHVGIEEEPAW